MRMYKITLYFRTLFHYIRNCHTLMYAWDYATLYQAMALQMELMEPHMNNMENRYVSGAARNKTFRIAKELLKRRLNFDADDKWYDDLKKVEDYFMLPDEPILKSMSMGDERFAHLTPKQTELFKRLRKSILDEDAAQQAYIKDYFFRMLSKHIDKWWD